MDFEARAPGYGRASAKIRRVAFCQLPLAPLLRVTYYPKWQPRKATTGFSRRRKTPMPTGRLFFPGRGRLFFVDFSVIKARKLHETRCKAFPFESLVDGGLKTNHRGSEAEGPRI